MRGATGGTRRAPRDRGVSIHAPHARGDTSARAPATTSASFNPRPSCEGRPRPRRLADMAGRFQSTPLMRGATAPVRGGSWDGQVSIHAPHARGDPMVGASLTMYGGFNPRPSCEGRQVLSIAACDGYGFQSTPLMRGATWPFFLLSDLSEFQSTPLMRGATGLGAPGGRGRDVSIHAPHARGDSTRFIDSPSTSRFQSTPLMRGATKPLHGVIDIVQFQSTPLMRGATRHARHSKEAVRFQSTPLMRGATRSHTAAASTKSFQSTPLMRGATSARGL